MTQAQLTLLAGILCLLMTVFLSALHVVSSKKRDRWMDFPTSVRIGIMAAIAMSLWRGIQFLSPEPIPYADPGIIQAEGALFLLVLTYTLGAISVWVARRHLTGKGWDRLRHVEDVERTDPDKVPVMMSMDEIVDVARRQGIHAVAPRAAPHELQDPPRPLH